MFPPQHDQIYEEALNLNWIELPRKQQHLYKYFIQRCQNPTLLNIGGFLPLNLDTNVIVRIKMKKKKN